MAEPSGLPPDERKKQQQNLIVLVVVLALLCVGGWLVDQMLTNRRIQNCIEARHKNCIPIDLPRQN